MWVDQAEDGIRDTSVTGVQTCALPISALARGDECPFARFGTCFSGHDFTLLSIYGLASAPIGARIHLASIRGRDSLARNANRMSSWHRSARNKELSRT